MSDMRLNGKFRRFREIGFTIGLFCLAVSKGVLPFESSTRAAETDWNIVWNDEFDGNTISASQWNFDIGNGMNGWGNNELEYYTSRSENAYVDSGLLHIVARQESYSGFDYTSAKLKSAGLFAKKYGRFEFRARFPQGKGYWPALWMMPADSVYGGWAASGEIDLMEARGSDPRHVLGTIHYGGQWPNNVQSFGPPFGFPSGDSVTNFHTYMLDWGTNSIQWFVDGRLYETQTSWYSTGGNYPAPFDQPFYLIMNLAVGGNFDGNPDSTTVFPGEVQVDYVRVYDRTEPLVISVAPQSDGSVQLSWPTNIVCHLQSRTNSPVLPDDADWHDVPAATVPYQVNPASTSLGVFYRLQSP